MANSALFASPRSPKSVPAANTQNNAGGKAYKSSDRHALAQIACTNCFNGTFYASAEDNLKLAKNAALALLDDPEYIAKVALYSREKGYMKDMPAFLTVVLADVNKPLFRKVFRQVINNGKMLRNVVQMARSGAVTSKRFNLSAGTWRNAIQEWFDNKSPRAIFNGAIGNDPTMKDVIRMAHPKANTPEKAALFAYLLDKEVERSALPALVREYEEWKEKKTGPVPDVDFRYLDSLGLQTKDWTQIAENAPWTMTRMNLMTFARHGVFNDSRVTDIVAERLRDKEAIAKAMVFPYQIFSAWREIEHDSVVPFKIKDALQDAMEIAIDNVPAVTGNVHVCVDMSGSMSSPITGYSGNRPPSKIRCVDGAALVASAILRKNRSATIWTFNHDAVRVALNPRDTVLTNASKLAHAGGGTNVSLPLRKMNAEDVKADTIVYVSDYESWLDSSSYYGNATGMAAEWQKYKTRNPKAKLICIDLTPRGNSQINERADVLQVGGFSDQVFNVMSSFVEHGLGTDHWVAEIDRISLD